jgi:hypothetical protein
LTSVTTRLVALETNLARKGFVTLGPHREGTIEGVDMLGHFAATQCLRLVDLEVLAWLIALREPGSSRVVFSSSQLARDLFSRPAGGRERRLVAESLARLTSVELTFDGYAATTQKRQSNRNIVLLASVARRNGASSTAEFGSWLQDQITADYVTYLDWSLLRQLRGLAKRLWIYLEAEQYRKRTSYSPKRAWLALGARARATLGSGVTSDAHFKAEIVQAARRICEVDPSYAFAVVPYGRGSRLQIRHQNRRVMRQVDEVLRHRRLDQLSLAVLDEAEPEFPLRHPDVDEGDPTRVVRWSTDWETFATKARARLFVVVEADGTLALHTPGCHTLQSTAHQALNNRGTVLTADRRIDVEAWLEQRVDPGKLNACDGCFPPDVDADDEFLLEFDEESTVGGSFF